MGAKREDPTRCRRSAPHHLGRLQGRQPEYPANFRPAGWRGPPPPLKVASDGGPRAKLGEPWPGGSTGLEPERRGLHREPALTLARVQTRPSLVLVSVLGIAAAACGGAADSTPTNVASPTRSMSPIPDASTPPPTATSSLADHFSDPSTGWDATGIAKYRKGKLVVGDNRPAAALVPSPLGFDGPVIVTATASIDGPGVSVIGLFCAGRPDLSSAYIGFVDPVRANATIGRWSSAGPQIMGEGKHIDEVVSLEQPLALTLTCTRAKGQAQIRLELDGKEVVVGVDPTPLIGPAGGLYFEYTKGGTVGIFDDFDIAPAPRGN